ncbi:unnamed protein product [Agarophyton chilense]|eukprot:gb/GEZJ01000341.1/.p1 GENE.gb/GEZJ01000341.1/~~gb/GEZJ01000341.1/.p1  ORF type:complete len:821 (+),score=191.81 gb/GEZJ01000341.1/:175-2637(+)
MKRVGNRSAQLVRSASRRGKTSSRFQFDITVHRVDGVKPGLTYHVKWSRGVKVATTKPVSGTKESAQSGLSFNEKLSLLVTLYKEDGNKFDPKDAKLALIAVNQKKQIRTAAKLHFDLSQYAGVPTASVQRVLKLSDKVSIHATIESRFLKSAGKRTGSAGASSALSGVSARSSDDFDDDFDDLAVDDVPEPEVVTASAVRTKRTSPPLTKSVAPKLASHPSPLSSSASPANAAPRDPDATATATANSTAPISSTTNPSTTTTAAASPPPPPLRRARPATVRKEDVKALRAAEEHTRLSELHAENERLLSELQRFKAKRSNSEDKHRRELDQLRAQIRNEAGKANDADVRCSSMQTTIDELRKQNDDVSQRADALVSELSETRRSRDEFNARCKKLSAAEEKCKQLSRDIDRLTVAMSQSGGSANDSSELEERLLSLRKEKEALEARIKGHESHALKVKDAYQSLTGMYNKLRDENMKMTKQVERQEKELLSRSVTTAVVPNSGAQDEVVELRAQLEEALQQVSDEKSNKESLQSDYDRLDQQVRALQDRSAKTIQELEESREETKTLYASIEDIKSQRDAAMKRASQDGNTLSTELLKKELAGQTEEEKRELKERFEKEQSRLSKKTEELENEITVLREDIEYEKAEKVKAREERDKLRDHARLLERKTSQAAKQADELHSVRRQLSTQQMRDKDQTDMITDLRAQVKQLQIDLGNVKVEEAEKPSSSIEDIGEVLQELVAAKLALAQAEDDKLNLQFSMKKLRKNERMTQQRLAAHASRLEVKLGQATEELEKFHKEKKLGKGLDSRRYNELDSDIDY